MVAYGDRVDPDNWQIMYFCPSCRDCGWVYSGESRIYYIHPPEFFEKVKVYRKNFINGSWCWESSEEPSSPTPSGWKLYRSPRGIFRS
jgi:hypothetical protein